MGDPSGLADAVRALLYWLADVLEQSKQDETEFASKYVFLILPWEGAQLGGSVYAGFTRDGIYLISDPLEMGST